MERVLIIGCGGSGKSTMARKLGARTGLPVVHLDQVFWREGWTHISREEFDGLLSSELEKPRWIMDGNHDRTMPERLARCDTVIFLDLPRAVCLLGVMRRIVGFYGRTRPDMAPNCPERLDREFLRWVWNFRRDERPKICRLLQEAQGVRVVTLKSRRQVRRFLARYTSEK